jgi:hypothetical protein
MKKKTKFLNIMTQKICLKQKDGFHNRMPRHAMHIIAFPLVGHNQSIGGKKASLITHQSSNTHSLFAFKFSTLLTLP